MMPNNSSLSDFYIGKDELGVYARASIDPEFFSKIAILKTAYWFSDHYFIFLARRKESGFFEVEFRLKKEDKEDLLITVCGEFLNSLLDQEIRQQVIHETKEVRDTLIKKAFFEAKAPLPPQTASTESHLPNLLQSYNEDPLRIGQNS